MTDASIRPLRPIQLAAGASHVHDLAALGRALMIEAAFRETGRNAATVVVEPRLRVTVTAMRAGVALEEHRSGSPTTLIVLLGEIDWKDASRAAPVRLGPGGSVTFGGSLAHQVTACLDSAFALVFGATDAAHESPRAADST